MTNKILVVSDKIDTCPAALRQASAMANILKASIHIAVFCYENLRYAKPEEHALIQSRILEAASDQAEIVIQECFGKEVEYTLDVIWEKKVAKWVSEYCDTNKPSMVVKTGHRSETLLYTPTDWHMLREIRAPLLIAAEKKWRHSRNILAAIDLGSKQLTKQELNERILQQSKQLADSFKVELHVCYVPQVSPVLVELGVQNRSDIETSAKQTLAQQIDLLSKKYAIPLTHFHIKAGQPAKVIPSLAADHNVSLVAIGTVGRKGLGANILGNTAEKVLALLKTDVLAMKPV